MNHVMCDLSISIDGFAAGPDQSLERPFGAGPVDVITRWMFEEADPNAEELRLHVAPVVGRDRDAVGVWADGRRVGRVE